MSKQAVVTVVCDFCPEKASWVIEFREGAGLSFDSLPAEWISVPWDWRRHACPRHQLLIVDRKPA